MEIERHQKIVNPEFQERLWDFYHTMFAELNRLCPLAQTLDQPMFQSWLTSSDAMKFVVQDDNKIKAFAVVSSDLRHDPLISIPYWEENYPGKTVYHFPAIAIAEDFRHTHTKLCLELMQAMMHEVKYPDGVALFFHSEKANPAMPRLVQHSCAKRVVVSKLDSMACALCQWTEEVE